MAAANNVALDNAHDALADTGATLGIARLIRQRAPALWDLLMANARKSGPLRLLQSEPFLLLSEYYGNPFNFIVAPIAANAGNANEWALFDLQFDPAPYLDAGDADLSEAIDGTTKVIRRVSINAQPGLLPVDMRRTMCGAGGNRSKPIRPGRRPFGSMLNFADAYRACWRRATRIRSSRFMSSNASTAGFPRTPIRRACIHFTGRAGKTVSVSSRRSRTRVIARSDKARRD